MSDPKPCKDCFENFHNNEYCPCDENLMTEHCKTLKEWKVRHGIALKCVDSTKEKST